MLQSRQDLIPGQIFVRNVICGRIYAKLNPDNLIRNRHIIVVDNEGKQTEQDMAQDLKLPFNIQVNVTYAKKTFFCQISVMPSFDLEASYKAAKQGGKVLGDVDGYEYG